MQIHNFILLKTKCWYTQLLVLCSAFSWWRSCLRKSCGWTWVALSLKMHPTVTVMRKQTRYTHSRNEVVQCLNSGTNALPISPPIAEGQINLRDEHPNPSSPYLLQDNGGAARAGCWGNKCRAVSRLFTSGRKGVRIAFIKAERRGVHEAHLTLIAKSFTSRNYMPWELRSCQSVGETGTNIVCWGLDVLPSARLKHLAVLASGRQRRAEQEVQCGKRTH